MAASRQDVASRGIGTEESGQAVVEFACVAFLMIVLLFGLIDFARAIYDKQVMANLTREGSNLASRGTDLPEAAAAVISGSAPLDLNRNGRVIVTSVFNKNGAYQITGQIAQGGSPPIAR